MTLSSILNSPSERTVQTIVVSTAMSSMSLEALGKTTVKVKRNRKKMNNSNKSLMKIIMRNTPREGKSRETKAAPTLTPPYNLIKLFLFVSFFCSLLSDNFKLLVIPLKEELFP